MNRGGNRTLRKIQLPRSMSPTSTTGMFSRSSPLSSSQHLATPSEVDTTNFGIHSIMFKEESRSCLYTRSPSISQVTTNLGYKRFMCLRSLRDFLSVLGQYLLRVEYHLIIKATTSHVAATTAQSAFRINQPCQDETRTSGYRGRGPASRGRGHIHQLEMSCRRQVMFLSVAAPSNGAPYDTPPKADGHPPTYPWMLRWRPPP